MTREEFIRAYADRSGLPAEAAQFAAVGLLDVGGTTQTALPCACGDYRCEGWAILSASAVVAHLELYAPNDLRRAYADAVNRANRQSPKFKQGAVVGGDQSCSEPTLGSGANLEWRGPA